MTDLTQMIEDIVYNEMEGWLFAPTSIRDIECRLSFIEASECNCAVGPHEDALHDLAYDDVPVLLKLVERLAKQLDEAHCSIRAFLPK